MAVFGFGVWRPVNTIATQVFYRIVVTTDAAELESARPDISKLVWLIRVLEISGLADSSSAASVVTTMR
jgi:hypothetical protein